MLHTLFHVDTQTLLLKEMIKNTFRIGDALNLVRSGANPNVKDDAGNTLLHILIRGPGYWSESRKAHVIELVVQHKADINQKNDSELTPLQCLLREVGFEEADVMFFVKFGADPNTKNIEGYSLLHMLTYYNHIYDDSHNNSAIEELVNTYQADVNITNHQGETALESILERIGFQVDNATEKVAILIKNAMQLIVLGANANAKNSQGESLLTLLKKLNRSEIDHHDNQSLDIDKLVDELVTNYGATDSGQYNVKRSLN